jgi:hypothetical protein
MRLTTQPSGSQQSDMAVNDLLAALVEIEEKPSAFPSAADTGYREIRRAEQLTADTYRRKGKERCRQTQ